MKQSDVEKEVEKTLKSFDNIKKASAPVNFAENVIIEKSLSENKKH